MQLQVNGECLTLEKPVTIAEFLVAHNLNAKMVVVEHNRVIVPRERYDEALLQPGDELEIVQMMAGG
jgi:sulfur carrier protein